LRGIKQIYPYTANVDSAENPAKSAKFDLFRLLKGASCGIIFLCIIPIWTMNSAGNAGFLDGASVKCIWHITTLL